MKQLDTTIRNATGLHARPARVFVNVAKRFQSTIRVGNGSKQVNAKSLISVLTLGVTSGQCIQIEIEGEDEAEAVQALASAIQDGLGEEVVRADMAVGGRTAEPSGTVPVPPAHVAGSRDSLHGIPAAPGIAIGPAYHIRHDTPTVDEAFSDFSEEERRLYRAIEQAREQLVALRTRMGSEAASEAAIFDVHLEILDDPELLEVVLAGIHARNSAAKAWQDGIEQRSRLLGSLDDPLLAMRAADLQDVGSRVLRSLAGHQDHSAINLPNHPVVVVAHDLLPSDTASLDKARVLGFCTAAGSPTSHAAIIARALGLPVVAGAGKAALDLKEGTMIVLDGETGTVVIDPDGETLTRFRSKQSHHRKQQDAAERLAATPAVTGDGRRVAVVANVGGIEEARRAAAAGAEGVGLLRTELLFLDRSEPPTEQEQFEMYGNVARLFRSQPVIVRTLDIGGDKPLPYAGTPAEANPFLGERGIRLCLNRPHLLRQQVRAILRTAPLGSLRIMFPMISDIDEFRRARQIVEEVRAELDAPQVEVGIMVEVPAAALMAHVLAREVDFFSIGTNDLLQYTLAIDRTHPSLAPYSDGLHPAVLQLIQRTVEAAHGAGRWVGVCGELGADLQAVPILVGLGVDELSVSPPAIATVKAQIRALRMATAQQWAQQALACATAQEVRRLVGGDDQAPV